jgi:hypothetical protein
MWAQLEVDRVCRNESTGTVAAFSLSLSKGEGECWRKAEAYMLLHFLIHFT